MQNRLQVLLKTCIMLLLVACAGNASGQAYGNFPFQATFLDGYVPEGVIRPNPDTNSSSFQTYGLELTPAATSQFGAVYLNNNRFKAELGIYIEFEYMAYDGTGGDGFSVFFFNAEEASPNIGAPGAGLGYAYNRTIDSYSSQRAEGLRGAYLGVGFDSYGNYSGLRWQGESRVQGISYTYYNSSNGSGILGRSTDNAVTIRGARRLTGLSYYGMGEGYSGYPVMVTQRTVANEGVVLSENNTTPQYIVNNQLKSEGTFAIRGGQAFERPTDPGYRKAYIEMFPNGDSGFYLSVMIEHDNVKDTVIYDYNYRKEFYYYENAYYNNTGDNYTGTGIPQNPVRTLLQTQLPVELKIGFAGSTGAQTDRHVIKNVSIRLPRSAEARDDFADDIFRGTTATFKPLENDIAYKGTISRDQVGSSDNIDPATFRFVNEDGTPYLPSSGDKYVYAIANEGTWVYDEAAQTVVFTPLPAFIGEARVRYDIKGKDDSPNPYADEAYRSVPAVIGVDVVINSNPTRNTLSNKMVTSRPG